MEDKSNDNDCGDGDGGSGKESGLRIVRRMREALIKSVAVGGLPKVRSKLSLKLRLLWSHSRL